MKKKITTVLLACILSYSIFAQIQWHTQCTRRPLTSINFISSTTALIFGGDGSTTSNILYKSTNRGEIWSLPIVQNLIVGGLTYKSFRSLCFVDSLYGWACQNNTSIFKTSNGGDLWYSIPVGVSFYRINGIYFLNRNTGWITGQDNYNHNQIARTTNGGTNWSLIFSSLIFEPGQIYMLSAIKGYVIHPSWGHSPWDSVASTGDGGYSWNYFRAGDINGQPVWRILFIDSLNGWLLGLNGYVSKTTNGGINWVFHSNSIMNARDMFFLNSMTGWIVAIRNEVWKTTNAGMNWVKQTGTVYNYGSYEGIYFKDQNTGWAISSDGAVIKSTNGGNNWNSAIEPPHGSVNDVYFTSSYTGWLVTSQGYISKTINGGNNWITLATSDTILKSVKFTNSNQGFVVGSSGKIFKTVNGGQNWDSLTIGNYSYNSVDFENSSTGWICGSSGQILKTTNSGSNWLNQMSGTSYNLNAIQFLNSSTGYIAGDSGKVLETTNGGTNWTISQPFGNYSYNDIFFINTSTGWIIGNILFGGGTNWGTTKVIVKTVNSGISWSILYSSSTLFQPLDFKGIRFIIPETGWVVTRYDGILKTTNGGLNWYSDSSPVNNAFNTIFFIDSETGWIGGDNGTILTSGNFPIGINKISMNVPEILSLSQNYPNPFNPVTRIKFDLPKSTNVKLVIYDVLGREIETIIDESKKPGSYEVVWPAPSGDGSRYASGVYFYKLVVDDPSSSSGQGYVETKKMVLIK